MGGTVKRAGRFRASLDPKSGNGRTADGSDDTDCGQGERQDPTHNEKMPPKLTHGGPWRDSGKEQSDPAEGVMRVGAGGTALFGLI